MRGSIVLKQNKIIVEREGCDLASDEEAWNEVNYGRRASERGGEANVMGNQTSDGQTT